MNRLENNNRMSIEMLNQRGGRMLSLVDLLEAGTLNPELAAEMAYVASQGGSMITAAGPGGVGKTTLMGALLAFLPPDTEIVTVEGENTLYNLDRRQPGHCQCLVVHEIGPGSYHGYLWGKSVARYFNLIGPERSIASNLHALTYPQAIDQLTAPTLSVLPDTLNRVHLFAFMTRERNKRRVQTVWNRDTGEGHILTWRWHEGRDEILRVQPPEALWSVRNNLPPETISNQLARFQGFLLDARKEGCNLISDLRHSFLKEFFR